jgi:outer membrane receptor protein involved in Fe transport
MKTAKTSPLFFIRSIKILAAIFLSCTIADAAELRGRVVDETGAVIAGAQVQLLSQGQTYKTAADEAGNFFMQSPAVSGAVRVSAPGFSPSTVEWTESALPITVTLKPAPVAEQIVVTAERAATRLDQTAANIVVLISGELNNRAAVTLDDALRQVPGFTLFRRSNSLTANPTTQGASARGVGASGASRLLVVEDGVPLNDPFGGWVFWDRVPRLALDHAEVLRGGGSALYGSGAFGGVVDLITRTPNDLGSFEMAGDSLSGHDVQAEISHHFNKWAVAADGENFGNDGTFVVAAADRGLVDTPATLEFSNGRVLVQRSLANKGSVFLSGSLFAEERNNGTALQINSTHLGEIRAGIDRTLGHNLFSARVYGSGEHYHQSFSSISTDRNSEALTRWQTVPSGQIGFSMNWARPISSAQISFGTDARFIHGESDETVFVTNLPTSLASGGGRSNLVGGFAEISKTVKRLRLSGGIRLDWWMNDDGFNRTTKLSDRNSTQTLLSSHKETAWSPRLGAVYELGPQWQLTASTYKAFRAPVLNELYRSFRLGNVLTLANDQLRAEHLYGGEAGIRYLHRRLLVSGSFFQQHVANPVANVTQSTNATLITRQRENLGSARAHGMDGDLFFVLPRIQLRAGYEYLHSTVSSFSANPTLIGKHVPQVPTHTVTFSGTFAAPRAWTFIALLRASSGQFDDDLNQFYLHPYSVVGISISKQIGKWTWFANAANILDTRIQTAATPVLNYGLPRIISGGVRFTAAR